GNPGIYPAAGGGPAPCRGPAGGKRGLHGGACHCDDAVRFRRNRPDHERDRGLWHRRAAGPGSGTMSAVLRTLALTAGVLVLVVAVFLLAVGQVFNALVWGAFGAAILVGTLYERVRYKALLPRPPGGNFQKTAERFIDPESGKPVTVYTNPASGERLYVQE